MLVLRPDLDDEARLVLITAAFIRISGAADVVAFAPERIKEQQRVAYAVSMSQTQALCCSGL